MGRGSGLSVVEFTVVAAVLAVLAALTTVAVMGTTSGVARSRDVSRVQRAVDRFHTVTETYPTASRALPDAPGGSGVEGTDFFLVSEGPDGVDFDVDGDGDVTGTIVVAPIEWDAGDPIDPNSMFGDYLPKPRHAEPEEPIRINSTAPGADMLTGAWVLDEEGTVRVLVPRSAY